MHSQIEVCPGSDPKAGCKLANVAIDAAGNSSEISAKWTSETIDRLAEMSKARVDRADYSKALTDYASSQADIAASNITAFADLAKRVQLETVDLMVATGKELSQESSDALKKAANQAVKAAKSAAN